MGLALIIVTLKGSGFSRYNMGSMGTLLWCWGFPCSIHPRWTVFLRCCHFVHTTSKTELIKLWRVASIFDMQSVIDDYDHHNIYLAYGYHVIKTMNSDLGGD